jgi:hypothetical protein
MIYSLYQPNEDIMKITPITPTWRIDKDKKKNPGDIRLAPKTLTEKQELNRLGFYTKKGAVK